MALMAVLSGCSGGEPESSYEVPEELCGTPVGQDVLSRLLPAGKKINVQEKTPVPSRLRCQVNVDGEAALRVSQEWWKKGSSITDVARGVPQLDSAALTDSEAFLQSGTGAAQHARCKSTEHGDQSLFVTVQIYSEDIADPAAVKKFVTSYTQAVEDSPSCR